jgi:glycogen synthase
MTQATGHSRVRPGPAGLMDPRTPPRDVARMRVLQIGSGWFGEHAGGLERVYDALMAHLPECGVDARGVVMGSPAVRQASGGRVVPAEAPDQSLWRRWRGVRRAVGAIEQDMNPDMVAAHFALYAFPVLDHLRRKPFVMHFHGPWAWEGAEEGRAGRLTRLKARLESAVYRRADRFIVLSAAFREELAGRYGIDPRNVDIVPGGVHVDRFSTAPGPSQARDLLGWPADRPVILAVRRLARRMGLEMLIDAMQEVVERVPDALLMVAGRGPLEEDLSRKIAERGLGNHVRLLGFVADDDLPLAYRAADVTIVPTVSLEGFGLITLESLAAGTPVLVTPVGGLPEAVSALSADLVLDAATPEAVADGVARALRGESRLPDAGRCEQHVRTHHDWPVIAGRVREVYAGVLS